MIELPIGPEGNKIPFTFALPHTSGVAYVLFSGGADSTILLHMINEEARGTDLIIQPVVVRKSGGDDGKPVSFTHMTGLNLRAPIVIDCSHQPHNLAVSSIISWLLNNRDCVAIYSAENRIPPIQYPFGFDVDFAGLAPDRPPAPTHPKIFVPFHDLSKAHIIDLYFQLGAEHLLESAHSCTQLFSGRCGECWQCLERAWAFQMLQKPDPGYN